MAWTRFYDMSSGGDQKLQYKIIYIELPEKLAREEFERRFGRDPDHVTCHCCGEDFSVSEYETLTEATEFDRSRPGRGEIDFAAFCQDPGIMIIRTDGRKAID